MRICVLFFIILNTFLSVARHDSLKLKNFYGVYFNLYYAPKLVSYYENHSKYSDEYNYRFEVQKYNYQSPAFGIGYVLNYKGLFIKTDFNYWFASKDIDSRFQFYSNDKNGKNYYDSFSSSWTYSQYGTLPVGSKFYKINDHYTGRLNIHYYDISMVLTGNITRFLRLYSGFRFNQVLMYNYNGRIERDASLYEVKKYVNQYQRVDSLISTEIITYENKAMKEMAVQNVSDYFFYNLGLNFNFRIKSQVFMVDMLYETNRLSFQPDGPIAKGFTVKLAYLMNNVSFFGNRKSKD